MSLVGLPLDEREMILDLINKVKDRMLSKEKIITLDEKEEFPLAVIEELLGPNVGLQLLFIPEEFGGMGGGARDIAAVSEAMAKICLGLSTAFLAIHLGTDPILVGGTHEQKEKWLTKIAEDGIIVAYAVTEPEAGSNLASFKTTAEPIRDSEGNLTAYSITGNKQFISNGGYADLLTVLAQTPEGPSFFVVEKGMKGFTPGKAEVKHGIRCSNTAPLTFDNVVVPAENLLGGVPGKGLQQANSVFGYTRLMVAAFGLGAGMAALEKAVEYAKQRVQFGSLLIEKQGYTHKLIIPNKVRLEAARAYIEESAERLDSGEEDLQVEGAIAKYFTTEAGNRCADNAIQAFGGYGYITEYEVEKIKRDVKITTIYEGTSEILQLVIGTFRWKATVKSKGGYYTNIHNEMNDLQHRLNDIGAGTVALAAEALNSMILAIHRVKLIREQHVMFEISDVMTQVEVGAALMRKIDKLDKIKAANLPEMKLIGRLFAAEIAETTIGKLLRILYGSDKFTEADACSINNSVHKILPTAFQNLIQDMDQLVSYL